MLKVQIVLQEEERRQGWMKRNQEENQGGGMRPFRRRRGLRLNDRELLPERS